MALHYENSMNYFLAGKFHHLSGDSTKVRAGRPWPWWVAGPRGDMVGQWAGCPGSCQRGAQNDLQKAGESSSKPDCLL